ncbi:MAG: glmZ(sRNA)-inactivating NTPase [Epulopiscium sp. Nele67-Bin002]|nr:MAG: RNase adaptor protein RapZ [Epulopiscium sp. Nuni2H_MBin001]OON92221.1 MAG: glmZ(sRNA)-inactivating NTPase [Epulopiscium sp. Nele67-Bin002]OON93932.1 MAG: RNase adaptor protein RapZ [Epulopiscium sp. Nele67-Bin001]
MEFIIVTGMSGAGKTTAIKFFEDIGYYCIDNLPPALLLNFIELIQDKQHSYKKMVLGIDIRGGILFEDLFMSLDVLKSKEFLYKIIFFDCQDVELIKRFKETRRLHPLARNERIHEGVIRERKILAEVKAKADYIMDTTHILPKDTKEILFNIFETDTEFKNLMITILVFGFKYGIPIDADLVFDVRFMPNPYYIAELRPHTGHDIAVKDYVMQSDTTSEFLIKLKDMISFLVPLYTKEGKNQLVIGIGCTGGKHRSVVVANELENHLKANKYIVKVEYRDIDKDTKRGK